MKFERAIFLPGIAALGAVCVTSALAFGNKGPLPTPNSGPTTLTPEYCNLERGDLSSATEGFVQVSPRNFALQLTTDPQDSNGGYPTPYGKVANGAFPTFGSLTMDVSGVDCQSVLFVTCTDPNDGFIDFAEDDIGCLPLTTVQPRRAPLQSIIFTRVTATEAFLNCENDNSLTPGAAFRNAAIIQFNDCMPNSLLVQNVQLNNLSYAGSQLVTPVADCVTVFNC